MKIGYEMKFSILLLSFLLFYFSLLSFTVAQCTSCATVLIVEGGPLSKACTISCSGSCTASCPTDCTEGATTCNGLNKTICQGSPFTATVSALSGGIICSSASASNVKCYSYVDQGCDRTCGATCTKGETQACTVGGQPGAQACQGNCQWGDCTLSRCGDPCPGGIYDGTATCYTGAGSSCSLKGTIPTPESGYIRSWAGSSSSPRSSGVFKSGDSKVCHQSTCGVSSASLTITGSFSNITYPGGKMGKSEMAHKTYDTIQVEVKGVTASNSWIPLVECRLNKFNTTGHNVGGVYFNSWTIGNVIFNYTVLPSDTSGNWTVDYCGLYSDFTANYGWALQFDDHGSMSSAFKISTGLVAT